MKNDKEDNFKKLIQQAPLEQPPTGFTDRIMGLVQVETRQDAVNENALQTLLRQPGLAEHPSHDFSRRIMGEVEAIHATKVEPIIPRRTWYLIAASVVLVIVCCCLVASPATTPSVPSGMDILLIGISRQLEAMPVFYPLTIIAVSLLMLADYHLRQRISDKLVMQ